MLGWNVGMDMQAPTGARRETADEKLETMRGIRILSNRTRQTRSGSGVWSGQRMRSKNESKQSRNQ